jgi:hypothetical protein
MVCWHGLCEGALTCEHKEGVMHSEIVRRAVLVSELKLAHEESARLSEMIPVLQGAGILDAERLQELQRERKTAVKRAMALHRALRKLDAEIFAARERESAANAA